MYHNPLRVDSIYVKAIDLVKVGKHNDAFDQLSYYLSNKKLTKVWSQTIQDAVYLAIELAVKLKNKTHDLKMILNSYKASASPQVFIEALQYMLKLAEAASASASTSTGSDKEFEELTPEALAVYAFDGKADASKWKARQNQADSSRFLWEAYRVILDNCRNVPSLQDFYHEVARAVVKYCYIFKRLKKFAVFCSLLREHYATSTSVNSGNQYRNSNTEMNIIEVQRLYLRTRMEQLTAAVNLELWSESYLIIDDIHHILYSAAAPITDMSTLMRIYDQLSYVYLNSNRNLYSAYCLIKLRELMLYDNGSVLASVRQEIKDVPMRFTFLNSNIEEVSSFILMNITLVSSNGSNDDTTNMYSSQTNTALRPRTLLSLPNDVIPSKQHITEYVTQLNIMGSSLPDAKKIYTLLSTVTSPFAIRDIAFKCLTNLSDVSILALITPNLRDLLIKGMLQRLNHVYTVVTFDHVQSLLPNINWVVIEKNALLCINEGSINLRIDYINRVFVFNNNSMDAIPVSNQLCTLAKTLNDIVASIEKTNYTQTRQYVFQMARDNVTVENDRVFERLEVLKTKKIEEESVLIEQEQAKRTVIEKEERARKIEKQKALEEAAIQREKEFKQLEAEKLELVKKQQMLEVINKTLGDVKVGNNSAALKKMNALTSNLENVSAEELLEASKKLEVQRKVEKARALMKEINSLDYLVRAIRHEDNAIRKVGADEVAKEALVKHEAARTEFMHAHKQKYEANKSEKNRLLKIRAQLDMFVDSVMDAREAVYNAECDEYEAKKKVIDDERNAKLESERLEKEAREKERQARFAERERLLESERERVRKQEEMEAAERLRRSRK